MQPIRFLLFAMMLLFIISCQESAKEAKTTTPMAAPSLKGEVAPSTEIFTSGNTNFNKVTTLAKYRDSLSYSLGSYLATNFQKQDLLLNSTVMTQGYVDVIKDTPGLTKRSVDNYLQKVGNILALKRKAGVQKIPIPMSIDSISYALGADMGYQQKGTDYEMHADAFQQGLADVLDGKRLLLNEKEKGKYLNLFMAGMKSALKERNKSRDNEALDAEEEFMKNNRREKGIVTMPSGLQYRILRSGEGKSPILTDQVLVRYEGKLADGTVFDSNFKKPIPAKFTIGEVIPGWVEGLQMMSKGSKFQFYVPSRLAYGPEGSGSIPPNAMLIFEVELVDIL